MGWKVGPLNRVLVAYTVFLRLENNGGRGGRICHNNIGGMGWKSGPLN
jgi:hypothetical protein